MVLLSYGRLFKIPTLAIMMCCFFDAASANVLTDNARFSLDSSARVIKSNGTNWSSQAIGLDVHKVFSTDSGDVGTLVFQPYLVHIENAPNVPPLFDDNSDTKLQWRIANFNYTGLAHGRFNIRVGHFEMPFGLEHVVPTNGTLHQLNAPANSGLKADWGVSINGDLRTIEYEIAHMKGVGNDFRTDADGVLVGRIGTPRDNLWWLGFSFLNGEFETPNGLVDRERIGVDASMNLPKGFRAMAEFAVGEDERSDVKHLLTELSWLNRSEDLKTFVQWRTSNFELGASDDRHSQINVGLLYEPNQHWSISTQFARDLKARNDRSRNKSLTAQLRYRFQ